MSFKVARATPSSAVATSGTITYSYPDGTNAGDYASYGHKAFAKGLQVYLEQDNGDMSVSFGASDITFTYAGSTSIPANTEVVLQLNRRGQDDGFPYREFVAMPRLVPTPIVRLELGAPDTADADGILESQDLTAAGAYSVLAFNGVYGDPYSNVYAKLDVPRNVVAAWTGAAILTVTGYDEYGVLMVEKSASGTSFTGKKAFSKITSLAVSANVTSITVGTGDVLGLPVYLDKVGQVVAELKDGVVQASAGPQNVYLMGQWADISAADSSWQVCPVAGRIKKMWTILDGAITGADAVVTLEVNTVAVDGLSITIANSGSAAGDVDSDTPTAGHATAVVAAGDKIEAITDGASSTTAIATWIVEIEPTYVPNGTFVAGVQTAATATTGDVRGTYDPAVACDGSLTFALLVAVADPTYKGVDQYDG